MGWPGWASQPETFFFWTRVRSRQSTWVRSRQSTQTADRKQPELYKAHLVIGFGRALLQNLGWSWHVDVPDLLLKVYFTENRQPEQPQSWQLKQCP